MGSTQDPTRRLFLRGSPLFAAAFALAARTAGAQPPAPPPSPSPSPSPSPPPEPGPAPSDPPAEVLYDDEGREYRICPQCGSKMYKQGRTWTCDSCGFSYVE